MIVEAQLPSKISEADATTLRDLRALVREQEGKLDRSRHVFRVTLRRYAARYSVSEIARAVGLSRSRVSGLIHQLEKEDWT